MAFSELETARIKKKVGACVEKRRPAPHIRVQVDISFCIKDQSVFIFEVRPNFREPDKKCEIEVAKATFVRTRAIWRVYWMRADLKWHRYDPLAEVGVLEPFLEELNRDPYACFWG